MSVSTALLDTLASATEEVFDTMLSLPLGRPAAAADADGPSVHVVAAVAFAGYRRGLVVVDSSLPAARMITGSMLGLAAEDVNGEVPDAMGEIANMVAGTFRNRLIASEPSSHISVPVVTIGTDFATVYAGAAERGRCPFTVQGESLAVELILIGEPGEAA